VIDFTLFYTLDTPRLRTAFLLHVDCWWLPHGLRTLHHPTHVDTLIPVTHATVVTGSAHALTVDSTVDYTHATHTRTTVPHHYPLPYTLPGWCLPHTHIVHIYHFHRYHYRHTHTFASPLPALHCHHRFTPHAARLVAAGFRHYRCYLPALRTAPPATTHGSAPGCAATGWTVLPFTRPCLPHTPHTYSFLTALCCLFAVLHAARPPRYRLDHILHACLHCFAT